MELQWIYTAISAIILTLVFVGGVVFLSISFTEVRIEETDSLVFLNRRSAAQIMEECLKNNGKYITSDFLDSFSRNKICSLCGICAIELSLKIKDLEAEDKEWDFGYGEGGEAKRKNEIFTSIESGDEIHVGKIYVQV